MMMMKMAIDCGMVELKMCSHLVILLHSTLFFSDDIYYRDIYHIKKRLVTSQKFGAILDFLKKSTEKKNSKFE